MTTAKLKSLQNRTPITAVMLQLLRCKHLHQRIFQCVINCIDRSERKDQHFKLLISFIIHPLLLQPTGLSYSELCSKRSCLLKLQLKCLINNLSSCRQVFCVLFHDLLSQALSQKTHEALLRPLKAQKDSSILHQSNIQPSIQLDEVPIPLLPTLT